LFARRIASQLVQSDETVHEWADRRLESTGHLVDDRLPGEDVALDGEAGSDAVAGPGEALVAGEGGGAPVGTHDAELARLAALVLCEDASQRLVGRRAVVELVERALAVDRHACRLGRAGADAGAHPRDDRAHGEVPRLHGATDLPGLEVGGDDRERRLTSGAQR
jgi:hypothetical protein